MARRSSSKIPAASSDKPQSGQRIKSDPPKSKFELIAELGRGGMATVYLARARKRPDKLLVLKQLRTELADNPEFLAMFLEEARLAGKLQHPNIVETFEVGQDAGVYYIAMEYLEGLSLQTVLTKFGWKGELSFPLQVFVLIEALKALEQAYTQRDDDGTPLKIVHRDVSPPNIILTFDGQVKLVDFGIAKAANSHVETRTGLIKGKLTYMAPEQAQSGDVDSRTDIYSVGVMLWQAAAGSRRWKGIENTEVLKRLHSGDVVESPRAQKNKLPTIVDDIVLKAIAADPEQRHRSASAFRMTLESLLREMNANVTSEDLSAFMTTHFGEARKRAADVMKSRLAELDTRNAAPAAKESVTAIRTSSAKAAQKTPTADASAERSKKAPREGLKAQVGGAASSLAEKVARAPSKTPSLADSDETARSRTVPSARRKSNVVWIGLAGTIAAAVLAYLALRNHSAKITATSVQALQPPAPISAAQTPQADSAMPQSIAVPPPALTVTPAPASSALPARPASIHSPRGSSPSHAPKSVAGPPGATTPAPIPIVSPPAVTAAPTPLPAPTTATTGGDPSVDRQDPWSGKPATTSTRNTAGQDPWGK